MCPLGRYFNQYPSFASLYFKVNADQLNSNAMVIVMYIEDLTRVAISYEIYETSLRRVS